MVTRSTYRDDASDEDIPVDDDSSNDDDDDDNDDKVDKAGIGKSKFCRKYIDGFDALCIT